MLTSLELMAKKYIRTTVLGHNPLNIRLRAYQSDGVLSPLLWRFVVYILLNLQEIGHIKAYADDVCVLISGRSLEALFNKKQVVLNKIEHWCELHL